MVVFSVDAASSNRQPLSSSMLPRSPRCLCAVPWFHFSFHFSRCTRNSCFRSMTDTDSPAFSSYSVHSPCDGMRRAARLSACLCRLRSRASRTSPRSTSSNLAPGVRTVQVKPCRAQPQTSAHGAGARNVNGPRTRAGSRLVGVPGDGLAAFAVERGDGHKLARVFRSNRARHLCSAEPQRWPGAGGAWAGTRLRNLLHRDVRLRASGCHVRRTTTTTRRQRLRRGAPGA